VFWLCTAVLSGVLSGSGDSGPGSVGVGVLVAAAVAAAAAAAVGDPVESAVLARTSPEHPANPPNLTLTVVGKSMYQI